MRWIRNLLFVLRPGRRIVGTDLDGNSYIETTSSKAGSKPRREVITKMKHEEYEDGSIPVEWEAWIRRKREDPPTHDELIKKMQQREIIKERAKVLEQEERKKMEDNEQSLPSPSPIGHASSHVYKKLDLQTEPTRTGDSFQPGAWLPNQGGEDKGKPTQQKEPEEIKSDDFQPGAWLPPKTK